MDKRRTPRTVKRVKVRYGVDKLEKIAFSRNMSASGLFVQTNSVFRPGTLVQLELGFDEGPIGLWGRVAWAKRVPPQLAYTLTCGMGMSFVRPSPEWLDFYGSLGRPAARKQGE